MTFLLEMMKLGLSNLRRHKLRSFLTALGIILGVAAVIANASIGEGSKRQALKNLERLGAKNIILRSQKPPENTQTQGGQRRSWLSQYGITRDDVALLMENFPGLESLVPLKGVGAQVTVGDRRKASQAFGTTPQLLQAANLRVHRGRYLTNEDIEDRAMVAVIGSEVAREMFPFDDPIGSYLKIDDSVVRIVGVLTPVGLSGGAGAALVGRDLDHDIQIPITTAKTVFGDIVIRRETGSFNRFQVEISEVYLVAPTREEVIAYADLITRVMAVRHPEMKDISIKVPYQLLETARKDALTWALILSSIASISLLVGGIGIMNIMLASVTERTREIGIRRALGATRRHIIWQFLIETGVLSTIGGLVGVGLGVGGSLFIGWVVPRLPNIRYIGKFFNSNISLPTEITPWSIGVAFGVAAATGLIFGLYPALKAAKQDPIVALRHD